VVRDPLELGDDRAQGSGPLRYGDTGHVLDGLREGVLMDLMRQADRDADPRCRPS